MTYEEAKSQRDELEKSVKGMSDMLNEFPKTSLGLTTDEAKATARYKYARQGMDIAFARLRNFNARFVKVFAEEIRAERRARARILPARDGQARMKRNNSIRLRISLLVTKRN